jgi:6-pyruvoyltetrahydropterin/6-carboxytetrahydropterin synthase
LCLGHSTIECNSETFGKAVQRERGIMIEIFKEFTFEAAHHLAVNVRPGHIYSKLHGHSFHVAVFLKGVPCAKSGWVTDFGEVERALQAIRGELDHNYLNDIAGLELPTLENISRWIWDRLHEALPGLDRIVLRRGTCGEGCVYTGRTH